MLKQIGFSLMAILAACSPSAEEAGKYKGYELPPYKVISSQEAFEIREYAPQLVAEVTTTGDRDDAVGDGFKILAGYIFGDNSPKEKIAMTTPVTQLQEINQEKGVTIAMTSPVTQIPDGKKWRVRFGMPKKHTMETLPKAQNENIRFLTTLPQKMAVIKFTGRMNDDTIADHRKKLEAWVKSQELTVVGIPQISYYDDPFTFPWNRRNEVQIEIK